MPDRTTFAKGLATAGSFFKNSRSLRSLLKTGSLTRASESNDDAKVVVYSYSC